MAEQISLKRISAPIASIGNLQISNEDTPDPVLGFAMWGGKDSAGSVTKFLAKDKPVRVSSVNVMGWPAGIVISDALGNLSVNTGTVSINHNDTMGLEGGAIGERFHMTEQQNLQLHSSVTVAGAPLTISSQLLTFNFKTTDFGLDGNDLKLLNTVVRTDGSTPFLGRQQGIYPADPADLVTMEFVQDVLQGVIFWVEPVISFWDAATALPVTPTLDDRYIALNTGNGWTIHNIYQWNGSIWLETVAIEGLATYVTDEDLQYQFNGTSWIPTSSGVNHNFLSGLQGGTASQYYHLTLVQHTYAELLRTGLVEHLVLYGSNTGSVKQDAKFIFHEIEDRLIIGVDQETAKLEVVDLNGDGSILSKGWGFAEIICEGTDNSNYNAAGLRVLDTVSDVLRLGTTLSDDSSTTDLYTRGDHYIVTDSGTQRRMFMRGETATNALSTDFILSKSGAAGADVTDTHNIGKVIFQGKTLGVFEVHSEITASVHATGVGYDGKLSFTNADEGVVGEYYYLKNYTNFFTKKVAIGTTYNAWMLDVTDQNNDLQANFGHGKAAGHTKITVGDDAITVNKSLSLNWDITNQRATFSTNNGAFGITLTNDQKIGFNKNDPSETYDFETGDIKHKGSIIAAVQELSITANAAPWDVSLGSMANIEMGGSTGDVTINVSNLKFGATYQLRTFQGGAAPRQITFVSSGWTFVFPNNGADDQLTSSLSARDVVTLSVLRSDGVYCVITNNMAV